MSSHTVFAGTEVTLKLLSAKVCKGLVQGLISATSICFTEENHEQNQTADASFYQEVIALCLNIRIREAIKKKEKERDFYYLFLTKI